MKKWTDELFVKCFAGELGSDFIKEDDDVAEARLTFLEKNKRYSGIVYRINCSQCDFVYYGQTERALKTRVSEHKKAVLMFDHNSKLACHVHEHHHHMDFENVEVVGHEEHYHQRLFLEAWMSVKDPNAGNDHMVIPEVYKCLART